MVYLYVFISIIRTTIEICSIFLSQFALTIIKGNYYFFMSENSDEYYKYGQLYFSFRFELHRGICHSKSK